jgi:hypothetical protein
LTSLHPRWLIVVTHFSQSPNEVISGAQAHLSHLTKLVSYGNIGFLVAALDFAVITLSSVGAGVAYHYFGILRSVLKRISLHCLA